MRALPLDPRKHLTANGGIASAPVPDTLRVPLDQHADTELKACVAVGDRVLLGQVIATPTRPLGAHLHAPVSGEVIAVERRVTTQHVAEAMDVIVLQNDGRDTVDATHRPRHDWQQLTALQLCEYLALGGIVGLGGAVFSAAIKLAECRDHRIEHLIVNGMECEPYISCDDALMRERASEILHGVQILLHACAAPMAIVAIEDDKPDAMRAMQAALEQLHDERITIAGLPTAYPRGDEGQLIAHLLGKEIPQRRLPADIGVIVQNVATAYASAQWVLQARPLISRVVTITGLGVKSPRNIEARIGTPVSALIAACDGYADDVSELIVGGPMMGTTLPHDDFPVVKASNCFIAATAPELRPAPDERACIRCGECSSICPVYLMPQLLYAQLRQDNTPGAVELGLFDCIECGCCDFVCPSQIVLATRFRDGKRRWREQQSSLPLAGEG